MNKKELKKGLFSYLILFILMFVILYFFTLSKVKVNEFSYDDFINHMNNNEIKELSITPRNSAGVYEITGTLKSTLTSTFLS